MVQTTLYTLYTIYRALGENEPQHIDPQYREYTQFNILPPITHIYIHTTDHTYIYRGGEHTGAHTPHPLASSLLKLLYTTKLPCFSLTISFTLSIFPFLSLSWTKKMTKKENRASVPYQIKIKNRKKNYPPPCLKKFSKKNSVKKMVVKVLI